MLRLATTLYSFLQDLGSVDEIPNVFVEGGAVPLGWLKPPVGGGAVLKVPASQLVGCSYHGEDPA